MIRTGMTKQELQEFDDRVRRLAATFPEIVRVRYDIGDDWAGDPSITFKVLLRDEATTRDKLGDVGYRIRQGFEDELRPYELGYIPYFYVRGQSEQEKLKDPQWE